MASMRPSLPRALALVGAAALIAGSVPQAVLAQDAAFRIGLMLPDQLTPRYEQFGWASARLDDVVNYVPARVSALAVAALAPARAAAIWRAVRDDAPAHPSPNGGVIEAVMGAVSDRAVVEQRREHLVHGAQHLRAAAHVQKRFLLARERRLGQVLCRRRGSYGDCERRAAVWSSAVQALERAEHRDLERLRETRGEYPVADSLSGRGQSGDVFDVEVLQRLCDALVERVLA